MDFPHFLIGLPGMITGLYGNCLHPDTSIERRIDRTNLTSAKKLADEGKY